MARSVFLPVSVAAPALEPLTGRQVIFHGTNKSGSLAMTRVLKEAYDHAGRSEQFFSTYHRMTSGPEEIAARAAAHPGHGFFADHYLYGHIEPRSDRSFITILRHPLPRIVSIYQWGKKRRAERDAEATAYPTLDEWLGQKRNISFAAIFQFGLGFGPDRRALKSKLSQQDVFKRAQDALARDFHAIGLAEYFEESIFTFAHLCGLTEVPLWRQDNRNRGRTPVDQLAPGTVARIEEMFHLDFELYRWALAEIFKPQVERIDFGSSFAKYQKLCAGQYKDRLISDALPVQKSGLLSRLGKRLLPRS